LTFCMIVHPLSIYKIRLWQASRVNYDYCFREYLFWKTYSSLQYRAVSVPAEKRIVAEDNRIVQ
jgi:hypothetical protein